MAEVEELVKRIASYPGVQGCLVVSHDGIAVRTTLENNITVQYAALIQQLTKRARATVRDIEPQDDLVMLRIRTSNHELMIAPDKDFMLVVIQDPKTNFSIA